MVSIDCLSLYYLGKSLNLTAASQNMIQNGDCCFFTGVTCTSTTNGLRISSIVWDYKATSNFQENLSGNLNITAMKSLDFLLRFSASNQRLSGTLPPFKNISNVLNFFIIDNNQINGTINDLNQLSIFSANSNYLEGSIPAFTTRLVQFSASNNFLSGKLPTMAKPLATLNIHHNNLEGTFPPIPNSLNIIIVDHNSFTGNIKVGTPIQFLVQNNFFTSVDIIDSSLLTNCNLSSNFLSTNDVLMLPAICEKNGMLTTTSFIENLPSTTLEDIISVDSFFTALEIETYESSFEFSMTTIEDWSSEAIFTESTSMLLPAEIPPQEAELSSTDVLVGLGVISIVLIIVLALLYNHSKKKRAEFNKVLLEVDAKNPNGFV
eukprot:NODE_420_length_7765_cov_0.831855.p2 type:complete len:377 gc:universal NODE_420_length_7765_cov_0.831855:3651-4781(+)